MAIDEDRNKNLHSINVAFVGDNDQTDLVQYSTNTNCNTSIHDNQTTSPLQQNGHIDPIFCTSTSPYSSKQCCTSCCSDDGKTALGDLDLSTHPFPKKRHYAATACILTCEMCERLAFYSVSANIVLFGTSRLSFSTVTATAFGLVFNAFSNLFPVLGGYISDSRLGRFTTIWISFCINIIGLLVIQCSSVDFNEWFGSDIDQTGKRCCFILGAILMTLGTGGVKANISPFGAEQLESLGNDVVQSFFNWFYWAINVGALLAYSGVAYLQQNVDFTWGLFIPLAVTSLALAVFVFPRHAYVRSNAQGSALSTALKVMRQGCCQPVVNVEDRSESSLFALARKRYGGDYEDSLVDGVGGVVSVLPFCGLVVMYFAIYSQTTSTFFVQSERMDVRVGGLQIPAAMLNITGNIIILILIPIIDRLFYPCMRKLGLPLTHLRRIGIGMLLSAVAVVVAGGVEIYRKDVLNSPGGSHVQTLAHENFTASSVSVFVQVPQFALVGTSEIFTTVTCLEFAYTQAPPAFQGLLTGLFLAAWGVGNFLSMAILFAVEKATETDPWYGDEINEVKMENYMFLLAGLVGVNLLLFSLVAHLFKYRTDSHSAKELSWPETDQEEGGGRKLNSATEVNGVKMKSVLETRDKGGHCCYYLEELTDASRSEDDKGTTSGCSVEGTNALSYWRKEDGNDMVEVRL